jgi:hypothetical protein
MSHGTHCSTKLFRVLESTWPVRSPDLGVMISSKGTLKRTRVKESPTHT